MPTVWGQGQGGASKAAGTGRVSLERSRVITAGPQT